MIQAQRESIIQSLTHIIEADQIVSDPLRLVTYERDAGLDRGMPDALVFPRSVHDVVRIVQWAAAHNVALIARGAGTGLAGGAVAEQGGIILEFSHLKHMVDLDEAGRSLVAQAGTVTNVIDSRARASGLYYPPDPSSGRSSTIGGNIGTNSGGPHCFKYGVTVNYLTGLQVVLANGQVVRMGGRALDYPEYDLVALLTGAEGTLGIITEASMRLLRYPPAVKTLMAAFATVEAAGEAVSQIIAHGLIPATIEMMDQKIVEIVEEYAQPGLPLDAGAVMIVEVDGFAESVEPQIEEIVAILRPTAQSLRVAETAEERDKIWFGRKSAVGGIARLAPAYYLVDGTVPRSKLASTLQDINAICHKYELRVGYVFHAGDGNLHPLLLIENPRDEELLHRVHAAGREIMQLCIAQGGSITGEHGVGIEKRAFMPLMYDADTLQAMRDIKAVFDPHGRLNPGKLFPPDTPSPAPLPTPGNPPDSPYVPATAQEAATALRNWSAAGKSIRIRGGGTKSGGLPETDVLLSTEALRGIHTYAPQDLYVVVGAGTPLDELQAELNRDRMWVPWVSPWPESTIGGIIATNTNAPQRMRYGAIRDTVLAATIVLPNGRVIRVGRAVVKNVAGYDLPRLFVGSHGTLGLITDVTLKLQPQPRVRASLFVPLSSLEQGVNVGRALLPVCLNTTALLLCRACSTPTGDAPYTLVYTCEATTREDILAEFAQVRAVLHDHHVAGMIMDEPAGSAVWATMLAATTAQDVPLRVGVAVGELPTLLRRCAHVLDSTAFVADMANGLLYVGSNEHVATLQREAHRLQGYVTTLSSAMPAMEGSHGATPGMSYVPESLSVMQDIKTCWDERRLLNPGAFIV
jgi:D-lactate dehydrogenase (cytochrome)